jgi:hypothetical protein
VYSPVGMVEESVVAAAERDAVFYAGGTIVGPVDDVMDFAPGGRVLNNRGRHIRVRG